MPTLDVLIAFLAAVAVLNFMPGPSMLLVIAHAISRGARSSGSTIAGVVVGDAILIAVSLFGVGALLAASAEAFQVMKWVGATYLIYLGVSQIRAKDGAGGATPTPSRARHLSAFTQGAVVTLLNPKVIAFHIAFFPQFIDRGANLVPQMVVLGGIFLVLAAIAMSFYAVTAGQARRLRGAGRWLPVYRTGSGLVLIGAGAFMASLRRAG